MYLKKDFDIDFLTASKIDDYNLLKYDLLIFEGEMQDDNVFKEAKIDYTIKEKTIKFKNEGINCFYKDNSEHITDITLIAKKRYCFSVHHFNKNKNFKLDYSLNYSDEDIEKTKIYFYTKVK